MDVSGDDDGARAMNRLFTFDQRGFRTGDQRGVALIIVLWIFIFLFVVAFDFSADVREEANAAHRFSEDTQGYYLALAGFQRGVYEFITQSQSGTTQATETPAGFFDFTWHEEKMGNGSFRVRLVDEGGKVNLNRADENTLRLVFNNIGVEEPRLSTLVDSILDWLDPDNLHRISGAESDYYESLSPPYTAKNGMFDTVEELLWVKGVTPELFFGSRVEDDGAAGQSRTAGLGEIFSVDNPIDRVNLRTASAEVIHAVTGLTLERSRVFVEERKKLSDKTIGDLLPLLGIGAGDATTRMFVIANPSIISVEAEGTTSGVGLPRRVRGVVRGSA
ncbi:MAG: general secretion pathway protein GspK, partial [Deltaproteobacteria bacterium]|nr:general secretion pathway protein GspK [Deltaproteobacteria bacterium]